MIAKTNFKKFCVGSRASILHAMKVIDQNTERTCFVVDSRLRLLRVITDGDIRRAIIKGMRLEGRVLNIHNNEPFVIKDDQSLEDAKNYLSKMITVIPVINNKGQLKGAVRIQDIEPFLNIRSRKVLIIGTGYVGLTLAVILADQGFCVYGYDLNKTLITNLNKKKPPFFERGLNFYLKKLVGNNLFFISTLKDFNADIYILTVGTPINKKTLIPNTSLIKKASKDIGGLLKKNDLVILRSTVPIGLTRKIVLPILENRSRLIAGDDFYLSYCPERTVEGKALEELRKNPQIIGSLNPKSTELSSRLFNELTHTVIDVDSLEAAEMCKLLDNSYRDTIFAFSNQISLLCEKLGLNMHKLIEKVNLLYQRNFIPKPSPGVGGACLSKDSYIFIQNFIEKKIDCSYIKNARKINEMAPKYIYRRSKKILSRVGKNFKDGKVFIIGFAFKGEPETSDLRESTTIWFLNELKRNKVKNIWGYDPIVNSKELKKLGVIPCSLKDGFLNADAVFIMNNHKSYVDMKIYELIETMNLPALFFDSWQIFLPSDIRNIPGVMYAGIGVG